MTEQELKAKLDQAEKKGIELGIRLMQNRMLLACENGTPIELPDGRVYWVRSDIEHLRQVMDSIE